MRLDLDERRAQLLALGRSLFSERAYDGVSMDDLARVAGISKGLLYHYFPTKRDLYAEGLRATADELLDRTQAAAPEGTAPLLRVRAALDAYLDHVEGHATAFLALMRGGVGSDPQIAAIVEDTRTRILERLLAGAGATPLGERATAPRTRNALRAWLGAVEAASLDYLARRDTTRDDVRDLLVALLGASLAAIGARPESWR